MMRHTLPGPLPAADVDGLRAAAAPRWLAVLLLIVAGSIAVKVGYLSRLHDTPGFTWEDPDGYLRQAASLTRTGEWQWTPDAIHYVWNGTDWTLPPAYPVFLSLWYGHPDLDPFAAAVAQIMLSAVGVVALYWLVSALHSPRAGLAAATLGGFWFPGVVAPHVFIQETLFIPLVLSAFAVLTVSLVTAARPWVFAAAGALFAFASLTRAMPLYFLPLLLVVLSMGRAAQRVPWRQQLALFGTAAVVLLPYIAAVSVDRGHLVLIDNHAAILQKEGPGVPAPTMGSTAESLVRSVWADVPQRVGMARGMFQVYGRSWLYYNGIAADASAAARLEWLVRLWLDVPFVFVAVAAPWGLALARRRRPAGVLVSWACFVVVLSVVAGFSGARYRAPLEFVLMAGAAIAGTAGWNQLGRLRRGRWLGAAVASVVLAALTVPQLGKSFAARAAYGITREAVGRGEPLAVLATGASGFYVVAARGLLAFTVEAEAGQPAGQLQILVDGRHVTTAAISAERPTRVRLPVGADGLHYVEMAPETFGARAPQVQPVYRVVFR
jgi:4-amino-4-deoxy-L-arabinose transferase-like glycosyltransferase